MREEGLRQLWESMEGVSFASLIRVTGGDNNFPGGQIGIVIYLGENLAENWQSGDAMAFWGNGDHTCLDGLDFDVVVPDFFVLQEWKFVEPEKQELADKLLKTEAELRRYKRVWQQVQSLFSEDP